MTWVETGRVASFMVHNKWTIVNGEFMLEGTGNYSAVAFDRARHAQTFETRTGQAHLDSIKREFEQLWEEGRVLQWASRRTACFMYLGEDEDVYVGKRRAATSEIKSTYRNWVGPRAVSPDAACYREALIMDACPTNFDQNEVTNTCWAECPIAYPVECGMECIRQNDDCAMEVLNKKLWQLSKGATRAFDCANMMIGTMRSIIRYVRNIKTTGPRASTDKIFNILHQSNNIVTDLPMAIYICMGWDLPRPLDVSGRVLTTMNWILLNAIGYKDDLVSSWSKFKAFLIGANFTEAANKINETEIGTLSDALKANPTCGYDLRVMTDRT
uniref:Phospholipase D-like domain-containing protein n=1 Tax=Phytophthora ramorum TaxID=164328 RepID=H3GNU8_PHYRM